MGFRKVWFTQTFTADTAFTGLDYSNQRQLGGITAGSVLLRSLISVRMIYQGVGDITKPRISPVMWALWLQQDSAPDNPGGSFDPEPHHLVTGVMQPLPTAWNPTFAGSDRAWWVYATPGWVESEAQRDIRVASPYIYFVTWSDPFDTSSDEPPAGKYWVYTRHLINLHTVP